MLPAFELNGEFLAAAETMTRPVGLTPAWWQVLGATLDEPLTVAEIARRVGLGLARQACSGWPTCWSSAAGRRSGTARATGGQLLEPTPEGRATVDRLTDAQHAWADAVGAAIGEDELRRTLAGVRRIIDASRAYRAADEVHRPGR